MEETLKMMKSILTGKEGKEDEKELIIKYQTGTYPNILAYFYSQNYGLLCNINKLYPIINEEDKASFCLQELDKCLLHYNISSATKFITYFSKCYKNKLRMEVEQLLTQKRKIQFYIDTDIEIDNCMEDNYFNTVDDTLNNYKLTNKEKTQCKLLNAGYSIKEIGSYLNIKPITIYKQISKIKEKILNSSINLA